MENLQRSGDRERKDICDCIITPPVDVPVDQLIPPQLQNGSARTGESNFLSTHVTEHLMSRINSSNPAMLTDFENRFRQILKRIYRTLQQHEIREEILDERAKIQWQWQQLASVVDRLLLVMFSLATLFTISFFLILPVSFPTDTVIMTSL